jgi:Putative lumazine-binding
LLHRQSIGGVRGVSTTRSDGMNSSDRTEIEKTVKIYFDGLYEGDADKLASVFHETSALTYEHDGKLVVLPRDDWLKAVRERSSAKARDLPRDDAILSIDQSGPTTAFVKVKCQIPPRFFTDYLSLLKVGGQWQVVQKVFATDLRK